jgi:hypothetical protein
MAKRTCEHRPLNEDRACGCRARFRVAREHRGSDAQDSCGRHLAATAVALMQADNVRVIVTRIWEGSE